MMEKEYFNPIEQASRDEIEALQFQRASAALSNAYSNVPFYREKFDACGIHPDDFTSIDDLKRFPFTVKEDFRNQYPFGLLAVPMKEVVRLHASSGTTGKPTVVAYTQSDIDVWSEVVARSIYAAGGRKDSVVQVAYGYGLFTGGLGAHYGAEKLGATVIPISGGNTFRQVQMIEELKSDVIMVTPSYLLNIIEEYKRQGLDPKQSSLKVGIFGGEPWSNEMRRHIQNALNIEATDIYGLSEIVGPGVAQECIESQTGLTIWEDHFYPEIIDTITGEVLPDGEEGELVITTLSKQAMPIIRYRTKDITRLLPGDARSMRRIEKITGRNDDMIIVRGVNVFPSHIEEICLQVPDLEPLYQIELTNPKGITQLKLHVEMSSPEVDAHKLDDRLQKDIKNQVGISITVEVHTPNTLPRSEGKAVRVIDSRQQ